MPAFSLQIFHKTHKNSSFVSKQTFTNVPVTLTLQKHGAVRRAPVGKLGADKVGPKISMNGSRKNDSDRKGEMSRSATELNVTSGNWDTQDSPSY